MSTKYKNIPVYLKENARFCCWKYENVNGRKTKIPYSPHTGKKAKTNNPDTFCGFDTAINTPGYEAPEEINNVSWCKSLPKLIAITFKKSVQLLRR